ncbi:uncharacterized protein LOC144770387 [Lissotriton helveticus]
MATPERKRQLYHTRTTTRTDSEYQQLGYGTGSSAQAGPLSTRPAWRESDSQQDLPVVADSPIINPVVNISNYSLSEQELKILTKGLSYVPTSKPDHFTVKTELFKFFRKIRLKYFFRNANPYVNPSHTGLRIPSTFVPPSGSMSHKILAYEAVVWRDVNSVLTEKSFTKYNTSKSERTALLSLANNTEVVIKPADKGGAIVVQDVSKYESEINRQLMDGISYQQLRSDPSKAIALEILELTKEGHDQGFLSKNEFDYLNQQHPRLATIYTLPKIHKSMEDPPGRPIVSGCGSILEPLGRYIDFFLKPLAEATQTYLRDTLHTINIIEKLPFDPQHQLLVTCDVVSLYTCIPQQEALAVITKFLQTRPAPVQVPTEFIIALLQIAMTKKKFMFKNKFFLQTQGVAMGAPFAPDVAILYMAAFEADTVLCRHNPFRDHLHLWMRYIDDIFMIWNGDPTYLSSFHTWLNQQSPHLQFTIQSDNQSVDFLDITIYEDQGTLLTTLYRKPAERNSLLQYSSHHPRALRDNLPFGQFLRIRRNCSIKEHYFEQSEDLARRLKERGYPKRLVTKARKRAWFYPHEELLTQKDQTTQSQDRLVCVTTFSTKSNKIKRIINQHWKLISDDINQLGTPLHAFKKAKSVKDFVVRSLLPTPEEPTITSMWNLPPTIGHYRCGNCKACDSTVQTKEFHFKEWKLPLKSFSNCNTNNIIYAIICPCKLIYIGQTQQKAKMRILQHMSRIQCEVQGAPLVDHFKSASHSPESLQWVILEKAKLGPRGGNITTILNIRELKWMFFFNSIQSGLNEHDNSFSQLATLS